MLITWKFTSSTKQQKSVYLIFKMPAILKYTHATKISRKTFLPFSLKKKSEIQRNAVTGVPCSIGFRQIFPSRKSLNKTWRQPEVLHEVHRAAAGFLKLNSKPAAPSQHNINIAAPNPCFFNWLTNEQWTIYTYKQAHLNVLTFFSHLVSFSIWNKITNIWYFEF